MTTRSSSPTQARLLEPQAPTESTPKETRWYVTYGAGSHLQNCYSEFHASSHEEANRIAFAGTGGKHAFLYARAQWETSRHTTQADDYSLREVPLQPQRSVSKLNRGYLHK